MFLTACVERKRRVKMSELSKKARNRTRVQMVLTMLVIVSIIRQFFLGNYHNMFLGILTLILFMGHSLSTGNLE